MPEGRDRFERAEAANRAAARHLRRTQEFLEETRRQLDELKGDVQQTNEHLALSRRFLRASETFIKLQRDRLRGNGGDPATDEPLQGDR